MYNPFSLQDKTILVTGASSGIGKAIAIESSKMGARVIISGRNEERLKETFSLLEGDNNEYLIADLSIQEELKELYKGVPDLDGLVNCAGVVKTLPFTFATRESFEDVLDVNFFAPAELTRLLVKSKKIKKGGSIVFISSITGVFCSIVAQSVYASSKGAINGLVKGIALDLAPKGIRVNSVNPGMVETEILQESVVTEEQLNEDRKRYPLGGRYGKPEEVAYATIYLLSDASTWTTGSNILIDGGYTLL
ncbi:MAG: 3-oxoacyl-ACP reductase [Bacteroidia bacterium 44-10]|jgi:NAD(P)-dependent dehydrogenase (short-subunit alcohol dehydrogenase family)|nr:MAG: 3-oxoacyl-ACP reductase [Bacteroidia bacterium 44-10]